MQVRVLRTHSLVSTAGSQGLPVFTPDTQDESPLPYVLPPLASLVWSAPVSPPEFVFSPPTAEREAALLVPPWPLLAGAFAVVEDLPPVFESLVALD